MKSNNRLFKEFCELDKNDKYSIIKWIDSIKSEIKSEIINDLYDFASCVGKNTTRNELLKFCAKLNVKYD